MLKNTEILSEDINIIDLIMRFEDGNLGNPEFLELFQKLVDSGLAWKLQGRYGRIAEDLIDSGFIRG